MFPQNSTAKLYGFPSSAPPFVVDVPFPYITVNEYQYRTRPYLFLYDIDGDGRDEIHYTQGYPFYFDGLARNRIYNSNGSLRLELPLLSQSHQAYLPADLDGNGEAELYQARTQLLQYDNNGTLRQTINFPDLGGSGFDVRNLSAVDLFGDGSLCLVVFGRRADVLGEFWTLIYDKNLLLIEHGIQDNKLESELDPFPPVWGDIDGDGIPEYFIHQYELNQSSINGYHADGSSYSGDSLQPYFAAPSNPSLLFGGVIADVNGDQLADVVACAHPDVYESYPTERLDAWDFNGQRIAGWPLVTVPNTAPYGVSQMTYPIIGDLDQNGITDITFCTVSNQVVFANLGDASYLPAAMQAPQFRYNRRMDNIYRSTVEHVPVCGDVDANSIVNISDAVYLIAYIFGGGQAPQPPSAGDVDCNGITNISDAVYLIAYIFGGGPSPCDPNNNGEPDC